MINLLPIKIKKLIKQQYFIRILVVSSGLVLVVSILAIAFLLPSYFLTLIKEQEIILDRDRVIQIQENLQNNKEIIEDIKYVNSQLELIINSEKNKISISGDLIKPILFRKGNVIKINGLSYNKKDSKMILEGVAPNRENLLLFVQRLEEEKIFSKVNLPVSNFIESEDIEFNIELIILKSNI